MEIYYAPSLFCSTIARMLLLTLFLIPSVFSSSHLSNHGHPHPHSHLSNASDQQALLAFMSAIIDDPSRSLTSTWKPNVSFCHWTGIICRRGRQRVVSLNVSGMGLQGTISPLLGNLSFLRILDISNNSFYGQIPYRLGSLFHLRTLYLDNNQLQGSIPPTLGRCRSLEDLAIGYNYLIGNIPSEICLLSHLKFIYSQVNNLTGTIPACLGNISSLHWLTLGGNNLHGSVPSELGMLTQLKVIGLSENYLTGHIPSSLSNCTNLQVLGMHFNKLTGHIPTELCAKSTSLDYLHLWLNQLSGSIPASLFNCTNLQTIDLGGNQLNGEVPVELGKLMQLKYFSLFDNQLVSDSTTSMPILNALTNCSRLENLDLSLNDFSGSLPFSLGHLSTKLYILNLEHNKLTGQIPTHIGNLTSLETLWLDNNFFTGRIPSSFNMLQNLERLFLGSNNLQGNIPMEIGQLKRLGLLDLQKNNLSGRIPESIAHLQQLRYLYLNQNQLSNNIPTNIGKCVNLLLLDLSYNSLTGRIPQEVGGLVNLALYFNLSNNLLHGPTPLGLSKFTLVQAIDISANQLTGYIPNALGSCKVLEYLNLSWNTLEGPIPVSLTELLSLQDMDFSSNNLSGGIPMSLENLTRLFHVNFSFNKLSGEVPKGGVFKKVGAMAFMGNLGLCGPWVGLSPCSSGKHNSVGHLNRVIIVVIAITVTILVSCLFLGILWRQNQKKHILSVPLLNMGYQRISYRELVTATDGFSDANLLGVGSFGKVYKGVLNDGAIVAIKLLNLENEDAHKSFERECRVLGRIRHRNLIRIITVYSNLQIKAFIFPFMSNGSLEKWLYPNGQEESCLSLIQRLNIAIDIAQGMAYLHHHCFMQVVHCDLKPSNVLLGEDMTAYLTDFGIATICFVNHEDSYFTSTHALRGSMGYIPPEYGMGGHVTTKGDVYSYGILLLEMLTGKKPTHNMFLEGMNLQKWVGSGFPNHVREVVDMSLLRKINTSIEEDNDLNYLSQLINVGLLCTKESPQGRPTMMEILSTLQSIKDTFLSVVTIPKFQTDITHLLGSTSTTLNNIGEGPSSSTF